MTVDFTRGWADYVTGFGDLTGNLWLGLDNIHRLTAVGNTELIVDITDVSGMDTSARSTSFAVGNATTSYRLSVSGHIGITGMDLVHTMVLPSLPLIVMMALYISTVPISQQLVGGMITAMHAI